ncbi:MAG: hypothetical protein HQK83_11785 [Fibrobacteria bacterium]|nr:hypothetical protein [Fibrobacteria bacterium]
MEIKINYSENLPGNQYKTRRWSAELSQQVPDNTDVNTATRTLFEVAKSAVRAEVERAKGDNAFNSFSQPTTVPPNTTAPNTGNFNQTNNGTKVASEKQIRFLFRLGKNAGLSNEQISALPQQYFGKAVLQQLSSQEASQLISQFNGEQRKAA